MTAPDKARSRVRGKTRGWLAPHADCGGKVKGRQRRPLCLALPVRIPGALVISLRHVAFVRAVAGITVTARIGYPIHDAGEVADETLQYGFRRDAITRAQFERITSDLLDRLVPPTRQALDDARLRDVDLDCILLVGGSTRMIASSGRQKNRTGIVDIPIPRLTYICEVESPYQPET